MPGTVSLRAYADEWLASRTFSPLTYEAIELRLPPPRHVRREARAPRLHVTPIIGHLELRQIKPSTIQTLLRSMDLAETYHRVIFSNARSRSRPSTCRLVTAATKPLGSPRFGPSHPRAPETGVE